MAAKTPWVQHFLPAGFLGLPVGRMVTWVAKNLLFVAWARWRLHRHFRKAAAQVHDPAWARWRRWRRSLVGPNSHAIPAHRGA
jgi:hypothetical protein